MDVVTFGRMTDSLPSLAVEAASSYGNVVPPSAENRMVTLVALMGAAGRSEFQLTKGLEEVWGYEPSLDNMRALMNTFAHDASLVKEEIVKSRYEASIRPGAHEKYSSLFPEPRQRWLTELSISDDRLAKLLLYFAS